jgi:electron transport complex protein RnfC
MFLKTFKGGVHPPEHKDATKAKPIVIMPHPQRVIIPLQQHTGAGCEPLVAAGDSVKAGQKIGESKAFVSAPVHATISGKVTAIENHPHPVLPVPVRSIIIESEGEVAAEHWALDPSWESLEPKAILDKIREAGIVGLGGAAFPTHVKLFPPKDKKIDTLIINGVECEPFLTNDHRLMLEKPQEILAGIGITLKALGIKRAVIGIEKNKPDAIKVFKELVANSRNNSGLDLQVMPLKVKYPQGAEKQLIKSVLNREVPSGGLPFDVGVIVQNVGTALAVYEGVAKNKPLIERVVTVSGNGVKDPQNVLVRIGTSFEQVLAFAGGLSLDKGLAKIISGGPMMGIAQYNLQVPVIKGTSGILIMKDVPRKQQRPCIKCGHCVAVCPMQLRPNRLAEYAERDNFEECLRLHLLDCMECGACTFACSSGRPIVHLIKYAKLNSKKKSA